MDNCTYSIIIPHKNSPELLGRCIDSIPESTDIQIIVVDDDSDEHIVDFSNYPGRNRSNVEIYLTKEARGAGYARNVGMRHAKGKWLLFADADDFYLGEFANLLERYRNVDDIDVVYFNCSGGDSPVNRCKVYNEMMADYAMGNRDAVKRIKFNWWVPWNKMFSARLVHEHNLQFEEVLSGNDAKFCLLASFYASNIDIDTTEYYVSTVQPQSITTRKKTFDETLSMLSVMMRIWNFLLLVDAPFPIYKSNIIGFKKIKWIVSQYGILQAFEYVCRYCSEKRKRTLFPELMNDRCV